MNKNTKAHLEYSFDYTVECGIVLNSDEVKSLRKSSPCLTPSYCFIRQREIFTKNLNLNFAKNPEREKKLLLHRKQINKLVGLFSQKKYIIIPLEMYEKDGFFKLVIGAGKHLNKPDRREVIKEKEMKHQIKEFI